jgi:hypothetical protein
VCNTIFAIGISITQVTKEHSSKSNEDDSIESISNQFNPINIKYDPQVFGSAWEEVKEEEVLLEVEVDKSPHSPIV